MPILLTAPETTPPRTRAKLVALSLNAETRIAVLRYRLVADDDSAPRLVEIRVLPDDFTAFLTAASIDRVAIDQFVANAHLPGTVV